MGDDRDAPGPARRRRGPSAGRRPTRASRSSTRTASRFPPGEIGRIFVGHEMLFEGYTDGRAGRERIDGMMTAGDLGHLDADGRLFVDTREDDMIISGGENVYPSEIEEALRSHPEVADVAVVRRRGRRTSASARSRSSWPSRAAR